MKLTHHGEGACVQMADHVAAMAAKDEQIRKLREALQEARETMNGIAQSDWRKWEELASPAEFERWAKSRTLYGTVKADALLEAK